MSKYKANVHRFGDCVAASLGDGSTIYMTPKQARTFAAAIIKAARSVETEKFTDSNYGSFVMDAAAPGHNGSGYTHPRLTRVGRLYKDRQERFNTKRAWFVNAWRIVDPGGSDMVQPWCHTKTEAKEVAKKLGIRLIDTETI